MIRLCALTIAIGVSMSSLADTASPAAAETMTGWFSDAQCAAPRVAKGIIGPNNPECVKRCLEQGSPAVFVSEQAKAMFAVKDFAGAKAEVGYYVEITGTVQDAGKTISIASVKRLGDAALMCALPPKAKKQ